MPCNISIAARETAELTIDRYFPFYGVPGVVISDRDPHFISDFRQALMKASGTDIGMQEYCSALVMGAS